MNKSVKQKVLYLLEKYPLTNEDDQHLFKMYYLKYCLNDEPKDAMSLAIYVLESVPQDVITRYRRMIHREREELRGEVFEKRQAHAKTYARKVVNGSL